MSKQKGQGMTEYAVILALIVGIALAVYNSGSLQNAISGVFGSVTTTMENAEERQRQEADMSNAKQLAKILNDAIKDGTIKFGSHDPGDGDWVELSVQKKPKSNGTLLDGGAFDSASGSYNTVVLNGAKYNDYNKLWSTLVNGKMDSSALSVQQNSNDWYGVRVYGNGRAEYYAGSNYRGRNTSPAFDTKPVEIKY